VTRHQITLLVFSLVAIAAVNRLAPGLGATLRSL
jgi:hypothetical protein